jgi:hypothetical protein
LVGTATIVFAAIVIEAIVIEAIVIEAIVIKPGSYRINGEDKYGSGGDFVPVFTGAHTGICGHR